MTTLRKELRLVRGTFFVSRPDNPKIMVSRLEQVKFHIRSDDYFSTLATILDLTGQIIRSETKGNKKNFVRSEAQLNRLRDELMFLQNNYKIVEKKQSMPKTPGRDVF